MIHVWLNVAVLLTVAGIVSFVSCLSSTTWFDE